jgi:hypothetical protein
MMKHFLIFTVLFSLGISVFAQEYYYWYKGEKVPLELFPTRKFILLVSPDDTLALKNRLTEESIYVYPFEVAPIMGLRENDCWTIIEGKNLPDFTSDESVLYEVPGFKLTKTTFNNEVCPSHLFYVKLFLEDDFAVLEQLAAANLVTIRGSMSMTLWYLLECSKESAGNTLQMANLFYETGLFEAAEPEFRTFGTFIGGGVTSLSSIFPGSSSIYIHVQNTNNIVIDSKNNSIDNLQIFGIEGGKIFESSYSNCNRVNLNMFGRKGIYIFKVKLHSGDVICRKTIIK